MKINTFFISFLFFCFLGYGQYTVKGVFPHLAGQKIRLTGFEGMSIHSIDSAKVSEKGDFSLKFSDRDCGMAYLAAEDNKAFFVVLDKENVEFRGAMLSDPQSVVCVGGKGNILFTEYAIEHPKREQALSAWVYLKKIYGEDSVFISQREPQRAIEIEIQRIKEEDNDFLEKLDSNTYLSWYLPVRKLVSSIATIAQYRTDEIPATVEALRKLDYSDIRMYKSGLMQEALEGHYWLLENMGKPLDTVYREMNISTDFLIASLVNDSQKFSTITSYLFNLLERHSLFQASEYLALKILNQNSCTLTDDFSRQLESYRTMKKGNTAADIVFLGDRLKNGLKDNIPNRLSEIQSDFKVIVFGASWCPKCSEELSQIPLLYSNWKSRGVEVIFISLDTEAVDFKNFTRSFPFISACDYKKWETQSVKDYFVFATPTIYLLDDSHEIILRPSSVKQLDAWVDVYLSENK